MPYDSQEVYLSIEAYKSHEHVVQAASFLLWNRIATLHKLDMP